MAASAAERSMVQGLKEIVNCSEADILAALRECGMDPDQAVNRLLTQDTFHEVKSKRDKKKETKEIPEPRPRAANSTSNRGSRTAERGDRSSSYHSTSVDNVGQKYSSQGPAINNSQKSLTSSSSLNHTVAPDGPCDIPQPSAGSQSSWGVPGHRSMADIVKMGRSQAGAPNRPVAAEDRSYAGQFPAISNPVNQGTKQSPITTLPSEHDWNYPDPNSQFTDAGQDEEWHVKDTHQNCQNNWSELDEQATGGSSQAHLVAESTYHDIVDVHENSHFDENAGEQNHNYGTQIYSEFNDPEFRGVERHHVELNEDENEFVDVPSVSSNFRHLSLQDEEQCTEKEAEDHPAVIIPDHLQVTNTDCEHLSFGSFGSGAFSSLLPSRISKASVDVLPVAEELPAADQPDERSHESYLNGSLNQSSDEIVTTTVSTRYENMDAPVSESDILRHDALKADPLQFSLPSVSNHGYSNSLQPNIAEQQQATAQVQNISHISNLLQSSSLQNSLLAGAASAPPLRDFDMPFSPLLASQSMATKYNNPVPSTAGSAISMQETVKPSGTFFSQHNQTPQSTSVPTGPLAQQLALHQYSQPTVPLGPFASLIGYPYLPPSYPYIPPTALQQSYSSNGPFHQTASVPNASMKYSLPNYKSSISSANLVQPSAPSGYRGFGSSNNLPANFSLNPASSSLNIGLDEARGTQYKDTSPYAALQQHVDNSALWLNGVGSRTLPPTNNFYGYQGQGQHSSLRQGLQSSQFGSGVGYPNFYHSQAAAMQEHPQNPSEGNLAGSQAAGSQPSHHLWQHTY